MRILNFVVNRVHPPTAAGKPSKPQVTSNQLSVAGIRQPRFFALTFVLLVVICLFFSLAGYAHASGFGLQTLEVSAINKNGTPDIQAGSHPYELITSFTMNPAEEIPGTEIFPPAGHSLRDVQFELPPGFVGNPDATPRCNYTAFVQRCVRTIPRSARRRRPSPTPQGEEFDGQFVAAKPKSIPIQCITSKLPVISRPSSVTSSRESDPVFLDSSVRTGSDYGSRSTLATSPRRRPVLASTVKIWGVPAEASHDPIRGNCLGMDETSSVVRTAGGILHSEEKSEGDCPVDVPVVPLFTNPTSCGVPRTASLSVDDWEEPGNFATEPGNLPGEKVHTKHATLPELSGCEDLNFSPTLKVTPDGTAGSTPTGLNVELHVPQESTINPEGKGEADVKDTTVTLPPGVQLSPSAANGLEACSNAQIGFEGV